MCETTHERAALTDDDPVRLTADVQAEAHEPVALELGQQLRIRAGLLVAEELKRAFPET